MDMNQLRIIVETEADGHKETVSFNYPKYEEEGTPHEIWIANVGKVEESLEDIVEGAPWRDEYPLIHHRREERDDNGRVIRVHLDLYGRMSMVKLSLMMLKKAENIYVMANQLASPDGRETVNKLLGELMPPELKEKLQDLGVGLDALKIMPVMGGDAASALEQVKAQLKAEGVDIPDENIKIFNSNGKELSVPEDSLTKIPEGSDYDGPLDMAGLDNVEKGNLPFFMLPNPDPNVEH